MRLRDYINIAFKNIWRRKLRSFLTIISIVIGALSVVTVLMLIFGAKTIFMKQLESEGSFTEVTVTPNQENLDGGGPFGGGQEVSGTDKKIDDKIVSDIKKISNVEDASPSSRIWNLQSMKLKNDSGKKIRADVEAYEPGKATEKTILAGRDFTRDDGKGKVIIGSNIAESLGFEDPKEAVGKKLIFTTQKGYQGDGAPVPPKNGGKEYYESISERTTDIEAEVIGITTPPSFGSNGSIFITMKWGRAINSWSNWEFDDKKAKEMGNRNGGLNPENCDECFIFKTESDVDRQGYQTVYVKVNDSKHTTQVGEEIEKMGLGAITAEDMLEMFMNILDTIAMIFTAIGAISLGVATIGIVNTMLMAMYERTREIGIMRACGSKRKTIRRLFMFEASSLGFSGGIIGILIAMLAANIGNVYLNDMLSSEGMAGSNVISVPLWLMLAAVSITTLLGLLSGLYPAARAARVDPVEALRYE